MRGDLDRVGVAALGEQPLALGLTDPELLGDVGLARRRGQLRSDQERSRRASLNELDDCDAINAAAVARLGRRAAGLAIQGPACRRGGAARPQQICAARPGSVRRRARWARSACCGPTPWRTTSTTMAGWCRERGVELAPHGKTHMAPQLLARQFDAGACAVTVATISQARAYRAFGVRDVMLANELVDAAGLRWLAAELDADPDFGWSAGWTRCAGSS